MTTTELDDVECPPSGKSLVLRVPSLGVSLRLAFATATREEVREQYHRIGLEVAKESARRHEQWVTEMEERGAPLEFVAMIRDRRSDPEAEAAEFAQHVLDSINVDEVALCDLTGKLVSPVPITITINKLVLPGNNSFIGGLIVGSPVGIHIG